jgi:hypothetical protein
MTVIKIVPMPGVAGPTGDRGERGLQGEPGQNGLAGASAYATAVGHGFSGSEAQWLESLVGPKGDKGDKGDTGNTGMTGASAYQLAVTNGFTGSESQWLASLVGAKGDKGDTGERGLQGIQGPQGDPGTTPTVTTTGTYIPVLSGTGLSIANNVATGSYTLVGNLVFFRIKVPLTYVANFGTGFYNLTLPFAPAADFIVRDGVINDASASVKYTLSIHGTLGSTSASLKYSAGSQFYEVDYNSPVVLATADSFIISGTYERQA